jgi:hypothetical protein
VVGSFYRACLAQEDEGTVQFFQNFALPIHMETLIISTFPEVGVFLVHVLVEFITEGAVLLKGGKGSHRGNFAANGVPIAECEILSFREIGYSEPKLRL